MSAINVVQLDGLVLLKILNHCGEHAPEVCTGNLLGLDVDGRLEITSCFPMPLDQSDEDESYQVRMMQALRAVNVDNNAVGWYSSAYMGTFLTQAMIEAQYEYQKQIPNSVVIVYDPLQTTKGRLALKAFRLTPTLMENFEKKQHNLVDVSDVYQEVAIKVHNSHLVHGFLYELREEKSMSCDYDRLSLSSGPVLESHLLSVSSAIDDYQNEQSKFQYHQRAQARQKLQQQAYLAKRAAEQEHRAATGKEPLPDEDLSKLPIFKPLAKPSRLESFLISNQIHHLTTQINSHAAQGFNKLYIVDALHKTKYTTEETTTSSSQVTA